MEQLSLVKIIVLLLLLAVSFSVAGMSSEQNLADDQELKTGYQTIKGQISARGTGTISQLILESKSGINYLLETDSELKSVLQKLKGLDVVLTGRVKAKDGRVKLGDGSTVEVYNAKLTVELYNTYYGQDDEQVSVLGTLRQAEEELVLVTPDQQIIELESGSYHSLEEKLGQELVVNGKLRKENEYRGRIEVLSTRQIRK
ncbi:MAG: hypothetical protein ACQEP9_04230 [Bacillota bacterium]